MDTESPPSLYDISMKAVVEKTILGILKKIADEKKEEILKKIAEEKEENFFTLLKEYFNPFGSAFEDKKEKIYLTETYARLKEYLESHGSIINTRIGYSTASTKNFSS